MSRKILSIVIPCLNERRTIQRAILDARRNARKFYGSSFEIIISDNGSTDGTLELLKKIKGIKIINVPITGYGAALHWGIMASRCKYVVFADADLSYPFSNLSRFYKTVRNNYDLVLGSRMKGKIANGAMPFLHRYFGTPLLTLLIRFIYKIPTTDCNSGMRMVKKSFYTKLNMRNAGMEWASELLLKTALKRGRYTEVPIRYLKDKRGKAPHLSSWSDGWRHLKSILLLKPQSLYALLFIFASLTILFYKLSFILSFLFADLFVVLFLSLLTLDLLGTVIESKTSRISDYLLKFKLVPLTFTITIIISGLAFLLPEDRLGFRLFLTSLIGIIFMWVFLIETIKTHLVNRLP